MILRIQKDQQQHHLEMFSITQYAMSKVLFREERIAVRAPRAFASFCGKRSLEASKKQNPRPSSIRYVPL